ncbi:MAG: cold-shock DNA-binding protein family [Ramlibacter sp.]|jgi:hypothetical protein|nr:cold-shock DNA-binding protein family [Ramlibacter sp.]
MKNILLILVLAALGWYGWGKYEAKVRADGKAEVERSGKQPLPSSGSGDQGVVFFTCDGRNTCVQMTSCAEAKFFVQSCPGMNTQGNREGTTCEQQWCK